MPADHTPFHIRLRAETAASHQQVDDAYSRFSLTDKAAYGAFLRAHARALQPIEKWLEASAVMAGWRGRSAALQHDLEQMGIDQPHLTAIDWQPEEARLWGALYVVEGSRLGGKLLSRTVADELPRAYLSAAHAPGAWRNLLNRLDRKAAAAGESWKADAVSSAQCVFRTYADSAALELGSLD